MIGTKVSYLGLIAGKKVWVSTALPFVHPETNKAIDVVATETGGLVVSPEKAADIRKKGLESFKPGERINIHQPLVPAIL